MSVVEHCPYKLDLFGHLVRSLEAAGFGGGGGGPTLRLFTRPYRMKIFISVGGEIVVRFPEELDQSAGGGE